MAWYERLTDKLQPTRADYEASEPGSVEEVHAAQNWPMLIALAIFALAFATLVVLTARWAYDHWHHSVKPAPARTEDLPPPPPTNLQPS